MIDWKVRLKNKAFLLTFIPAVLALIYNILGTIGIIPGISQNSLTEISVTIINILVMLGIIVDPKTNGFYDNNN